MAENNIDNIMKKGDSKNCIIIIVINFANVDNLRLFSEENNWLNVSMFGLV